MSSGLDLRLLGQFVAICNAPNMTAAARAMKLSTPAISQIIRRLERELGVTLFERSPRGIRLTPAGNLVRQRARELLEAEMETLEALAPYRGQLLPTLRVHVASTVAHYVAAAMVTELNPMVGEIKLKSGRINGAGHDFLRGDFDILISSESLADIPEIECFRLCRENLIGLVPANLPKEDSSLRWLAANLPLIRFERGGQMDIVVESYLMQHGLNPPRTIESRTAAPILELIGHGLGWTIATPFSIAYYNVLDGKAAYMSLPEPRIAREIFLTANSGRLLDVPAALARVCRAALAREVQSWRGTANAILAAEIMLEPIEAPELQLRRA